MSTLRVDEITNQNDDGPVYFKNGVSGDGTRMTLKPGIESLSPVQLDTNVAISTTIQIAFTQSMQFLGVGTIYIREGSASGSISTYFTCGVSTEATIISNLLTINPSNDLNTGTKYFVTLPSVGIANTNGAYIDEVTNYQFETEYSFFDAQGGDYEQVVVAPASPTGYYKYNIFTSSGIATFSAPSATATDFAYVLVGGGGGGGSGWDTAVGGSGGGGAGGFVYNYNSNNLPAGNYTVTIGSGGSGTFNNPGGTDAPPTITPTSSGDYIVFPTNGQDSSFGPSPVGTIIAYGGGAGGSGSQRQGPESPLQRSTYYNNSQPSGFAPPPAHTWTPTPISPSPGPAPLTYNLTNLQWVGGGAPGGSGGGTAGAQAIPPTYYYNQINYSRLNVSGAPGAAYPSPTQQGFPGGTFNTAYNPGYYIGGTGGGGAGSAGGSGGVIPGPSETAGPANGGNGKASPAFPGPGLQLIPGFPAILASILGPSGLLAGGGGAGGYTTGQPSSWGSGGPGGGGSGGIYHPTAGVRNGTRGTDNTGGGGGGGIAPGGPTGIYPTPAPGNWTGQNGGSGVMMIRYAHPGA